MPETEAEQQRNRLLDRLAARRPAISRYYAYYRGDHPLPWAPAEVRDTYLALMQMSRANWCRLIVKAPAERLRVVGMRFSEPGYDTEAWQRYWQGNRLDLESRMVHDTALVAKRGFVLVWPTDGDGPPTITPEHPSQVLVDYEPGCRRDARAGLKEFSDFSAKRRYCTMWTRWKVYNWWAPLPSYGPGTTPSKARWQPWDDPARGVVPEAGNPLGAVPLVEFVCDPDMLDDPMGELDGGVLDVQDRINRTILDRMVTSNFSSFKQKWVTGLDIPKDDQGNDIEPFKLAANRLLQAENPDARFGEFSESSLTGYIASVESDIQHLAATTRTPPHYLLGQSGAFPSGSSLKATETGLVAKVCERRDSFTESWEDAMRLALLADGDTERAGDMALSMVWKDPESRSLAEVVDAATKMVAINVPWREVMAFIGYSPTEIDRLDAERSEDLATAILAPAPQPAAPPQLVAV
jgi:hypothetical protein